MSGEYGYDHGNRQQWYDAPCLATIVGVYPIDSDRRLYADALPHDNRGPVIKAPVYSLPGAARNVRKNMTVMVVYIDGNPQTPIIFGHNFNSEEPMSLHHDPLPVPHENIDDHVSAHQETGFWSRVRSWQSTPSQSAPDGSPAQLDIEFNGGTKLTVYEYPPTGYVAPPPTAKQTSPPPKPDRAKVTILMPSGLEVVADEPATGKSDVMLTHPSGMVLHIDMMGNVTISTPATLEIDAANIILNATNVQVGDKSDGRAFAFNADLVTLQEAFNNHVHPGVQSGGSMTSAPQTTVEPIPVGSQDSFTT